MAGLFNSKGMMHHFSGIRTKVVQIRELVETVDTVFTSFDRMGELGKSVNPFKPKKRRENIPHDME
ncbi:hypothetical protein [Brevibacillus laterosporus]|uniref:hypothetical protein n=1 Tax=Brevibacillus laterosporus TaxID=1465 RepID=UPI0003709B95|nr:hypothetical protein [Brevibacillus laterosporus]ATO50784.1 hypothetical protein BrL25_17830 [Brevibacillus laterosporus DSM 25]AYB39011.1 hypothetical protein D5F52_12425 [Brevibacillus laterosporus]MBG9774988.1 hypothetical protein [Brevibacillus laterosporus]MBG9796966.1 hypothetical protein [Brevibacillus laterosporus]MBG9801428.1 hypothetical protein [Brevibacillus laterosporus]